MVRPKLSEAVVAVVGDDQTIVREAAEGMGSTEIRLNLTETGPWFGMLILDPKPSASIVSESIRGDYKLMAVACSTLKEGREKLCQLQENSQRG